MLIVYATRTARPTSTAVGVFAGVLGRISAKKARIFMRIDCSN